MPIVVLVSGLPASGKTTLAGQLAAALGWPHLDKDALLEALFAQQPVPTPEHRRSLSRQADARLQQLALGLDRVVLSSWWRHPRSAEDSGTPVDWLCVPGVRRVEVHCECPADRAAQRFLARQRQPGHHDGRWTPAQLLAQLQARQALGPLWPAQALRCRTEGVVPEPEAATLAGAIDRLLADHRAASPPPPAPAAHPLRRGEDAHPLRPGADLTLLRPGADETPLRPDADDPLLRPGADDTLLRPGAGAPTEPPR